MKPIGFDKKSYRQRGFILAVLLVVAITYWWEWIIGNDDLWRPTLATIACILFIIFSEWKKYLIILSIQILGGLSFIGFLRSLITDEPLLPPIIIFGITVCVLLLFKAYGPNIDWLSKEDGIGEGDSLQQLKIGPDSHQNSEKFRGFRE